ncbi:SUR7/PalI family-domain-containing protein [Xylariaceae sp. FL0016]|nr:SUR7/PalI family-domain-containing protein [Xylariaceae sp. FL0016]
MLSRLGLRRTVHHVGTYLLFAAAICSLVPMIATPATKVNFLEAQNEDVSLEGGYPEVRLGVYGYCVAVIGSDDKCRSHVGYTVTELKYDQSDFSLSEDLGIDNSQLQALSTAMAILHPLSLATSIGAFVVSTIISLCFKTSKYFWPWTTTACAAGVTLITVSIDWVWIWAVRRALNDASVGFDDEDGRRPRLGAGMGVMTFAVVIQMLVTVAGFLVWWFERKTRWREKMKSQSQESYERMKHIEHDRLFGDEPLMDEEKDEDRHRRESDPRVADQNVGDV